MKRFIVFLLVLCLTLQVNVLASDMDVESTTEVRLMNVFTDKMQSIQKDNQDLSILAIKNLKDFSGDSYIIVECEPTGYMIYHPETGVFVETSPSSISPYSNCDGSELYYGGPAEYYQIIGSDYVHTITSEKYNYSDYTSLFKSISTLISSELEKIKNVALLDYIINNEEDAYNTTDVSIASTSGGLPSAQQEWFRNLNPHGYFTIPTSSTNSSAGGCGFIGLNMIYGWFDKFKSDNFMDNTYWTSSSKVALKSGDSSFSRYLYDLDPKDSTTSVHIHNVSEQYLELRNITNIDHTSRYWGFFTAATIKGILDNGYPVELFGSLADPPGYTYGDGSKSGHAVVAYAYTVDSSTNYICHYGWTGYTEVTIVGTLGSIYAMEIE